MCPQQARRLLIYAYEKTGRIDTQDNQHFLSDEDLAEWTAAIEEYEMKQDKKMTPKYPIGTVALYGPDDEVTTKIAAGVIHHPGAEPIIQRWVGTGIMENHKVQHELQQFFTRPQQEGYPVRIKLPALPPAQSSSVSIPPLPVQGRKCNWRERSSPQFAPS